jgi:hypothetical protein
MKFSIGSMNGFLSFVEVFTFVHLFHNMHLLYLKIDIIIVHFAVYETHLYDMNVNTISMKHFIITMTHISNNS